MNWKDSVGLSATKQEIRERIWSLMEKANVARFPKPISGRIPNFEGAEEAAAKLRGLKDFSDARVVKVSPDAPQRPVREIVLRQGKKLLVPTPRLRKGFLLVDPINNPGIDAGLAATIRGAWEYGRPVGLGALPRVDFIVTGSVAVSKSGVRVGKGGGYSEIEYGILRELRLVDESAQIVTTVHDLQVVEEVPAEEHDLTVDKIVTPTRIINICRKRPEPKGIYWDEITDQMLEEISLLKELARARCASIKCFENGERRSIHQFGNPSPDIVSYSLRHGATIYMLLDSRLQRTGSVAPFGRRNKR